MDSVSTFLAPGQRYAPLGTPVWNPEPQVTVLKVYRDPDGAYLIVQCNFAGEVLQTFATELEAKVAAGLLVPVVGMGWLGSC
jgi:hypothetical protein